LRFEGGVLVASRLRVVQGQAVAASVERADPWQFQARCVEAYVLLWVARGFSPDTVDNDTGVLERMLAAVGRVASEVTAEDLDGVVGAMWWVGRRRGPAMRCTLGSGGGLGTDRW
jgi:hypothetical protein